ncbi:M14 family zinc carboxypeptidase [candidate division KSB1 bacterium]
MNAFRQCVVSALLLLLFSSFASGQVIRTASEEASFEVYTSYEEMMEYLENIQATTTEMLLSDFGKTIEGRKQPYTIFSRPLITAPWQAMTSGKPIVLLGANIHGGEKTVRESLLILIRELATIGSDMNGLLDDLVVLVVPSINPDGFVHGSRGNITGVDMNRDWVKLEQLALQNYIQNIIQTWHPHVYLDAHNGGSRPYNITYQGPPHSAADQRITALCDHGLFPYIDSKIEEGGYKSWYYSGGDSTQWRTAPSFVRGSIGYGGLIDAMSILFESPGQDRESGAKSGLIASRAILEYVADNAEEVIMTVERARRETIEMGQTAQGEIPVRTEQVAEPYKVSYEISIIPSGRREGESREDANKRSQVVPITGADLIKKPVATKTRPLPYAYILEIRANKAIEMLKRHKVTIEVLREDVEIPFEAYGLLRIVRDSQADHPAHVDSCIVAEETVKDTTVFPKGTYIIRTSQPLGRLIAHVLEPETPDNVVTWNMMEAILPRLRGARSGNRTGAGQQEDRPAPIIPIFKLMEPTKLPTKLLKY